MTKQDVRKQPHYNQGKIDPADGRALYEPIKVIRDRGWGFGFCMGNAAKYIPRAAHKGNPDLDYGKARQYLEWSTELAKMGLAVVAPKSAHRLDTDEAVESWDLGEPRLIECATAILDGDPFAALDAMNVHLMRPTR